ncbi:hypothetical protein KC332_g12660 [Hortaea werneckii]|nr:hypothetical protein KC358_g12633 [Hortaea werneckii]KAI6811229.1 hypothetical protein KC350_g12285 [Hortaea werneckii]KAI6911887.1 hypothetical protein KC348_g12820 [Hortaea werneckii]KAI6926730.1 hypothetical protein KC341_g12599 [Hortaea werneckii]KAI6960687.1 hypothetical protein KC321_g12719 [Hortaea werneckii]
MSNYHEVETGNIDQTLLCCIAAKLMPTPFKVHDMADDEFDLRPDHRGQESTSPAENEAHLRSFFAFANTYTKRIPIGLSIARVAPSGAKPSFLISCFRHRIDAAFEKGYVGRCRWFFVYPPPLDVHGGSEYFPALDNGANGPYRCYEVKFEDFQDWSYAPLAKGAYECKQHGQYYEVYVRKVVGKRFDEWAVTRRGHLPRELRPAE